MQLVQVVALEMLQVVAVGMRLEVMQLLLVPRSK
jgi:hypothetical protein